MSEGAWITIAVSSGGFFSTLIVALIKSPWKNNGNGSGLTDYKKCPAHSGIVSDIATLGAGIGRIEENQRDTWEAIDEMRADIKELLQR